MTDAEAGERWAARQGRSPLRLSADAAVLLGRTPPPGAAACWVWTSLPDFFPGRDAAYESLDDAFAGLGRAVRALLRAAS